jgi:hypothetical protein
MKLTNPSQVDRSLPHTLRDVEAPQGTTAGLIVEGPAGGEWWVERTGDGWRPVPQGPADVVASVTLDEDTAWRLFTRGITPEAARPLASIAGASTITDAILGMVSIMA